MAISKKVQAFLERSSWIRKMFEEGARMKAELGEDKVYDFSLGNPPEEPPSAFFKEMERLLKDSPPGMHRYMSNAGFIETRQSVAQRISAESGLEINPEHVVMTVGAGGALNVILKSLLDAGDEVIVFTPYFVEYRFYIDNHNGVAVEVPTGGRFELDLERTAKAINVKTKALILNSPNNPTGVVYTEDCLKSLGDLLKKKEREFGSDIYVISDEPYKRLVYDEVEVPDILRLIDNSIIATSHSKDLALAGERIGYIVVNPKVADVEKLKAALVFANRTLGFVNAPALMQRAIANLQGLSIDVKSYQERRDLIYNGLRKLKFDMVKPHGAFYLFPKTPIKDDIAFVRAAQRHHILLAPGSGFGTPGYFRLAYSVEKKVIEASLPHFRKLALEHRMI